MLNRTSPSDPSSLRIALCVLLAGLIAAFLPACGVKAPHEFRSKPKNIVRRIDASNAKLLDLRFDNAKLVLSQVAVPEITIGGTLTTIATDKNAAEVQLAELDLVVNSGGFTMITLPAAREGIKYEADLTVGVPRNINLRVVVGEGSLKGDIQLPLMSDFQVLTGDIELKLPKNSSAYVHMENNFAEEFVIEGFDRMTGKPILQLTHEEFTGSIGAPINFLGNRLEARVNSGKLIIRAAPR